MEIGKIAQIEKVTWAGRQELFRLGTALLFIAAVMLFAGSLTGGVSDMPVLAGMIDGYMAMNIGANDVANNVGPTLVSRALTLTGTIIIVAVLEASGTLIAGGDVVGTIRSGIIDPELIGNIDVYIWVMTAALLAGALWLKLATTLGMPVSTTHSIVGGVLGAGIVAGGLGIADWGKVGQVVASWVISPVMGGVIAAAFLYLIKRTIMYQPGHIAAARRMVLLLIAVMAWALGNYLMFRGFKNIWKVDFSTALSFGLAVALAVLLLSMITVELSVRSRDNSRQSIDSLFVVPLIFTAALLSFAHGANDVANAIGPLAATADASSTGVTHTGASIPLWVMTVGAIGIALGLALHGPKLIRTVGSETTQISQTRAYCIALSAAITLIVATHLGLPVSSIHSIHIAVGAVLGVGFLREYLTWDYDRRVEAIELHHQGGDRVEAEAFSEPFCRWLVGRKGLHDSDHKATERHSDLDQVTSSHHEKALSARACETLGVAEDHGRLGHYRAGIRVSSRHAVFHHSRQDGLVVMAPVFDQPELATTRVASL